LLAGPPGVGKTKIIEVLAKMLGYDVVRINFSSNTTFEDLIGSFVPRVVNGQRSFEFQEGPLYRSLNENRRNTVILFDELNLARKELLNQLMPLFANENELFIPALAKSIPIDGSIIIAAMNPTSIGGGREKLPRSTQTHFIQVQLAAFEKHELMHITISLLRSHLDASYLTPELIEKINEFHYEISEKARVRQIGRLGGPYDFNLRDIEKLSNLIAAHSVTHRAHIKLSEGTVPSSTTTMDTDDENSLSKIEEQNIIRSLHVYLDIVYASRFEHVHDQNLVREMIRKHFALDKSLITTINNRQELIDSDLNLQGYTRLGFVYIEKKEYQSTYRPLVHSQRTLEKLQLLAAATVSKATVLIEGGDCSGKTATVCELARLCGRRILVLNLNHETTTSDLLGSWTVINKHSYEKRRKQKSEQLLNDIIRFTLAVLMPLSHQFYDAEQLIRKVTRLICQWEHRKLL
jgi:midasin (ATPase involved in ribosome maturation)